MLSKCESGYCRLGHSQSIAFEGSLARSELKSKTIAAELPVCVAIPVVDMFLSKRDQIVANLVSRTQYFFYHIYSGLYFNYWIRRLAIRVMLISICYDTFNVFSLGLSITFLFINGSFYSILRLLHFLNVV